MYRPGKAAEATENDIPKLNSLPTLGPSSSFDRYGDPLRGGHVIDAALCWVGSGHPDILAR